MPPVKTWTSCISKSILFAGIATHALPNIFQPKELPTDDFSTIEAVTYNADKPSGDRIEAETLIAELTTIHGSYYRIIAHRLVEDKNPNDTHMYQQRGEMAKKLMAESKVKLPAVQWECYNGKKKVNTDTAMAAVRELSAGMGYFR